MKVRRGIRDTKVWQMEFKNICLIRSCHRLRSMIARQKKLYKPSAYARPRCVHGWLKGGEVAETSPAGEAWSVERHEVDLTGRSCALH